MNQKISHYELLGRIGAGGMGEVFRARDTRLGRTVALKFLPDAFAQDRERLARFQREAQVLASLNHPNIASLYGFEEDEGRPFLVMELAEGTSLDQRLAQGAIPFDEAVWIALQIARALEEAHDRGVIHRDLKPGNVHVTDDGKVKVLDFGLAKALETDAVAEGAETIARSPTITRMTAAGVVLGTAAYMSPEQAKGKSADRRSDIWSFGVVLLEMLTGRLVFEGETVSETLASILKDPVPLERLPESAPADLRMLVARCLERDPKRRLQAVGEARIALEGMRAGEDSPSSSGTLVSGMRSVSTPGGPSPAAAGARRSRAAWVPWIVAALAVAAGAVGFLRERGSDPGRPAAPLRKFAIETGPLASGSRRAAVISPDGRRIAFATQTGIWVRDLQTLEARLLIDLPGRPISEQPTNPMWSPDGRQIAYVASERLWKIPAEGGSPVSICPIREGFGGGCWLADDRILFAVPRGDLDVVSARGGDPEVFLPRNVEMDVDFHDPWELPDGRGVVYVLHRTEGVDTIEILANGERRQVLRVPRTEAASVQVVNEVFYAPSGHLLYRREQGNLGVWAVPFSLESLETTGEPFLVAAYGRYPSVARDGTLLYLEGRPEAPRNLVWLTSAGEIEETVLEGIAGLSSPSLSPDGTRVAYSAQEGGAREIWVKELATGTRTRLTFTPTDEDNPVWIPGRDRIAFTTTQEGRSSIHARSADGSGEVEELIADGEYPAFTADGTWMLFQRSSETNAGLFRAPLDGSAEPEMFLPGTQSNLYGPELSRDGRYVSYLSWEAGTATTYIRPFPSGDGKWELPGSWESGVRWLADRIVYTAYLPVPAMMEIPVTFGATLSLGTPRKLFELGSAGLVVETQFSTTPDGRRILMVQDPSGAGAAPRVIVVQNWLAEYAEGTAAR